MGKGRPGNAAFAFWRIPDLTKDQRGGPSRAPFIVILWVNYRSFTPLVGRFRHLSLNPCEAFHLLLESKVNVLESVGLNISPLIIMIPT